ncbi:MFS general substrate transporter [Trichoderma camerunense]
MSSCKDKFDRPQIDCFCCTTRIQAGVIKTDGSSAIDVKLDKGGHKASRNYAGAQAKSDPVEIRLVYKLDFRIILMYFFNYVNQGAMSQAKLNSLETELDIKGADFNTAVSVLTVGYVLMQIPSNMLLTRVRPSVYLASWIVAWSNAACTGLVRSYGALLACRFLLGFFEAPFYPGALYLIAIFNTRKEVATRVAVLYTGQMAGLSFANLIAAGVFKDLDGVRGMAGWRWLLILEGASSGVIGILALKLLPNTPQTTTWLKEGEQKLEIQRMDHDRLVDSHGNDESVMDALQSSVKDPRTWLFCAIQNFHYALISYFSVIKSMGFSSFKALLLTCPPYIGAGCATILLAWSSGRFHERTLHITAGFIVAVIGFVLAVSTLNPAGRYVVCFIFPAGAYSVNSIIVGWTATTLSQSQEKKAITLAMTNVAAQIASIYGPYFWPDSDSPRYVMGFSVSAAFSIMSLLLCWLMRFILKCENKLLKAEAEAISRQDINTYGY